MAVAGAKTLCDKYCDFLKGVADEIEKGSQDWVQLFPNDAEGPGEDRLKTYGGWLAAHKMAAVILKSLDVFLGKYQRSEELLQYRRKMQGVEKQFADQLPIAAKKLETWIYNTSKSKPLLWAKSWFQNTPYLDASLALLPKEVVLRVLDYDMQITLEAFGNGEIARTPLVRMSTIEIHDSPLAKTTDFRSGKSFEILADGTKKDDEKDS